MRLYVGNLPPDVNEHDLTDLFSGAGAVVSAVVVFDRDHGRSREFGYVEMATDAEGERAFARFHGHELRGRILVVNEARPAVR